MASDTATQTAPAEAQHAHAAHAHHPSHLQHHFVSSEQQFDSAKLGMWIFLITEMLLFSGMFVAYAVYRSWHPEVFAVASTELNWILGGTNTIVLLASSLTIALSIHYAQKNDRKKLVGLLATTLVLAGVFLVIKYFEYTAKFSHGIYPGAAYHPHDAELMIPYAKQFFSIYFVMTGIHGFHVVVGMGLIAWLTVKAYRGGFNSEWYTPVELTGLYWHLVDIIWIFLFPLLYLI